MLLRHRFFRAGVAVPAELFFIREKDVRLFVAIDIGDRNAVANLHRFIDFDLAEFRLRRGGASDGSEKEEGQPRMNTNER